MKRHSTRLVIPPAIPVTPEVISQTLAERLRARLARRVGAKGGTKEPPCSPNEFIQNAMGKNTKRS